jgi:hypothetical protein
LIKPQTDIYVMEADGTNIVQPWRLLPALEWISNQVFAIPIALIDYQAATFPSTANIFASLWGGRSYILFFVILRAGIKANQRRIFRLLHSVFASLVILNAAGCLVHTLVNGSQSDDKHKAGK